MAKSLLVFLGGSTVIPIAVAGLVPAGFVKGHLQIPFWDGIAILAIALAVISGSAGASHGTRNPCLTSKRQAAAELVARMCDCAKG